MKISTCGRKPKWDACFKALKLLEQETIPTAGTVGMVKTLIETAIVIDERDYRWKSPFISR